LRCTTVGKSPTSITPSPIYQDQYTNSQPNSNAADLRLLEDIGITPDATIREKKPSLRTVGFAVIASLRMQKMREAWAGNKKVQEALVRKFEGMRRGSKGKSLGGAK
jgi:hypothetical protein